MKNSLILLFLVSVKVFSCTCIGYNDEIELLKNDYVFLGQLTEIVDEGGHRSTGYLQPAHVYKGNVGADSPIYTGRSVCSPKSLLKVGHYYLVYGISGEKNTIDLCSSTREISEVRLKLTHEIMSIISE